MSDQVIGTDWGEVRALCNAASKAPWTFDGSIIWTGLSRAQLLDADRLFEAGDEVGYSTILHQGESLFSGDAEHDEDAEFIAAARTALPAALDEIERLRADNDRLATERNDADRDCNEAEDERDALRAALDRVSSIHYGDAGDICWECSDMENGMTVPWPCDTVRAAPAPNGEHP